MDEETTITVRADSLPAAIAGISKGERWVNRDGLSLEMRGTAPDYQYTMACRERREIFPCLTGWHRVGPAPLTCPECYGKAQVSTKQFPRPHDENHCVLCSDCGLRGPFAVSEAEAREAWKRIGSRSPPWRRASEKPRLGESIVLYPNGTTSFTYPPFSKSIVAWFHLSDLPMPSWAKEEKR